MGTMAVRCSDCGMLQNASLRCNACGAHIDVPEVFRDRPEGPRPWLFVAVGALTILVVVGIAGRGDPGASYPESSISTPTAADTDEPGYSCREMVTAIVDMEEERLGRELFGYEIFKIKGDVMVAVSRANVQAPCPPQHAPW